MLMRSSAAAMPLLGAALLVVVVAATLPAPSRAAWARVPDDAVRGDPVIRQVAQFAVLVYGLAHRKDMAYVGVVRGETQQAVGGGTSYKLVVVAAPAKAGGGGEPAEYECLVWGVPGSRSDTWKLRRFRKIHS